MVLQDLSDLTQGDELAGDRDHAVGAAEEGDVPTLVPQRKIAGRIAPRVPRPVGLRDPRLITLDIDERPGPRKPEHGFPSQTRPRGDTRRIDDVQSAVGQGGAVRSAAGVRPGLDTLRCEVVLAPGNTPDEQLQQITERIREGLRFRADVVAVDELTPADGPILDTRTWE